VKKNCLPNGVRNIVLIFVTRREQRSTSLINSFALFISHVLIMVIIIIIIIFICSRLGHVMSVRSFQQIRGEIRSDEAEQVAQQSHTLHFFLANPNSIIDSLKTAVEKETGSVPSVCKIYLLCFVFFCLLKNKVTANINCSLIIIIIIFFWTGCCFFCDNVHICIVLWKKNEKSQS
jgi:ABC-type multidrug transport system fused ATPase/permease subunit